MVFFNLIFRFYDSMIKACTYNKSKSLLLKDTLCYSLDEVCLVVGETNSKVLQCCQVNFAISLLSPQRKWLGLRFHWKSLHIELLCAKYGWNWLKRCFMSRLAHPTFCIQVECLSDWATAAATSILFCEMWHRNLKSSVKSINEFFVHI